MSVFERDSKFWWLYLETTGQRESTNIPIGTTKQQRKDSRALAEQLYIKRMGELVSRQHGIGPKPALTFEAFVKWYDAHVVELHRGRERERQILPRLVEAFGPLLLSEIDRDDVITWRTRRLRTSTVVEHFGGPNGRRYVMPPPGPRTVNREVTILKQIFKAAVPKYLESSAIAGLPALKFTKPKKRYMTPTEETQLLAALRNPADRVIWMIGVDMLLRLTDILDLKKSDDHGTSLEIRDPKGGRGNLVPISDRVRAALDALPDTAGDFLFPHRRTSDTEHDRRHTYITLVSRAARRSGVAWGKKAGGNTFHWATRRTGATRLLRRGGEGIVGAVAAIGGWRDPSMLLKEYEEVTLDDMRKAMGLPDAAEQKKAG